MATKKPNANFAGRCLTSSRAVRCVAGPVLGFAVMWLSAPPTDAHEGHAPLPTKGVLVDISAGRLVLTPDAYQALGVQTADAALRPRDERVLAYATLQAPWRSHAFVTTQIEGRIAELDVRPGQQVEAGAVLTRVQSPELETLQLDLLNAENERRLSEKFLAQSEPLADEGIVPGQQVIEQRSRHHQNENAVHVARAKLLSLGLERRDLDVLLKEGRTALIASLPIVAPISGTVIHADVSLAQVVRPDEHLFEVVDYSTVWVRIDVLERDLRKIFPGQPVELTLSAYPGETFQGTITVGGQELDPTTHLGTVWAELKNPSNAEPRFLFGMRGQARIFVGGDEERLFVPAEAVLGDGPEKFVLVEESATTRAFEYRRESVAISGRTGDVVYLAGGDVFPGDRVVTTGGHELAASFIQGVLRPSQEAARSIGLKVEPAAQHTVEEILEFDGRIELPPSRRALAAAGVAGTLRAVHVDRGQLVDGGQVVAEVASLEFQNLQLELLRARLEEELARDTAERLRPLGGQSIATRRLWEVEAAEHSARNRREAAERTLRTLGLTAPEIDTLLTTGRPILGLPVRAAISGVITDFSAVLGQVVTADTPLFEIHDLTNVWVRGYLSERDLAAVQLGQPARVRLAANPDFVGEGTVVRSGRVLGEDDRTLSVWVEFNAPPEVSLRHNMLARLTLVTDRGESTLAVPPEAVVREGTRDFVFVRKEDESFERRPVKIGRSSDMFIEITRGLRPGELVAVRGATGLQTAFATVR